MPAIPGAFSASGPHAWRGRPRGSVTGSTYGRHLPLPRVARKNGRVVHYTRNSKNYGRVGFLLPGGILWHRGPLHSILVGAALAFALSTLHWVWAPAWRSASRAGGDCTFRTMASM